MGGITWVRTSLGEATLPASLIGDPLRAVVCFMKISNDNNGAVAFSDAQMLTSLKEVSLINQVSFWLIAADEEGQVVRLDRLEKDEDRIITHGKFREPKFGIALKAWNPLRKS